MDPVEDELDELAAEAFIPFLQDDLVELCLEDGRLPTAMHRSFRELCAFLSATSNFQSHRELEDLAGQYAYFNPDTEMKLRPKSPQELKDSEEGVVAAFRRLAGNANYRPLEKRELENAFEARSLINLRTDVDLDEFSQVQCYVRGAQSQPHTIKDWRFRDREIKLEIWRRVLLLMQFKEDGKLTAVQRKRREKAKLPYLPGKIYVYLFKDVPKDDIEILFPNVRVSMNLRDRILIGVPALVAFVGTAVKIGVKVGLVVGLIIFALFGIRSCGVDEKEAQDYMKVATAVLAIFVACIGFGFKQWSTVKNKRIGFLKEVSEHLFFRNIAMNKAVFSRIIEDGEDEDTKEAILVFYHLLTNPDTAMDRRALDETIQEWMKSNHDTVIDFDIDGPIEKLKRFRGTTNAGEEKALVVEGADGRLQIPSLEEAKEIMDHFWDNAFQYSGAGEERTAS